MAKCINCGKSNSSLKVNKAGLCDGCIEELLGLVKDIKITFKCGDESKKKIPKPKKINDNEKVTAEALFSPYLILFEKMLTSAWDGKNP